jgi:photosystem II stability/assembly factor-like uncharacterized protein
MSDFKDRLEQERRRFAMSGDSFQDLEKRRDRKRRNRRLGSGLVGLLIAAAGVGGGLYAFRPARTALPVDTPSVGPTTSAPGPTPTRPSPAPPVMEAISLPSGPIQFVDEQHGWAVFNGQVVQTSDGGMSWQGPLDSSTRPVEAIDFIDLQHGWALGATDLLRTLDGGSSWQVVSDQPFDSVDFLDAQTGWAIRSTSSQAAPRELLKTEDGGQTWTSEGITADSVCAGGRGQAWAASGVGDGSTSIDRWDAGSASWIETVIPVPSAGESWAPTIRCSADGQEAFVLLTDGGAAGHVAYVAYQVTMGSGATDDVHPVLVASFAAGEIGVDAYKDDDPYPGVLTVVGSGVAYFINWCPACDGSWASLVLTGGEPAAVTDRIALPAVGNPATPVGISFVGADHGWVLFQTGLLLQTNDGGRTWAGPCAGEPTSCFGVQTVP